MRLRLEYLILPLLLAACSRQVVVGGTTGTATSRDEIRSPDQLIEAMYARYAGKWYGNITFVQKSSYLREDGTPSRVETWYEAGIIPGRLRIDLGDLSRGNGVLYRNDSSYSIQSGRVMQARAGRNPLLLLGFDVYGQPPARTVQQLRDDRFNMNVLHMDTLYGKRMYVVGAGPGDMTSKQFWVEADRLLFVRLVETGANGISRDTRFERYVPHGGGWVAEYVRMITGGKTTFTEEYSNVRVNVELSDDLFIPQRWSTAPHWFKP